VGLVATPQGHAHAESQWPVSTADFDGSAAGVVGVSKRETCAVWQSFDDLLLELYCAGLCPPLQFFPMDIDSFKFLVKSYLLNVIL